MRQRRPPPQDRISETSGAGHGALRRRGSPQPLGESASFAGHHQRQVAAPAPVRSFILILLVGGPGLITGVTYFLVVAMLIKLVRLLRRIQPTRREPGRFFIALRGGPLAPATIGWRTLPVRNSLTISRRVLRLDPVLGRIGNCGEPSDLLRFSLQAQP
jgi:hypothetical protein